MVRAEFNGMYEYVWFLGQMHSYKQIPAISVTGSVFKVRFRLFLGPCMILDPNCIFCFIYTFLNVNLFPRLITVFKFNTHVYKHLLFLPNEIWYFVNIR